MLARLVLVGGNTEPATFELRPGDEVTLGRSRASSIYVHDKHASRRHADVYFENRTWMVRDRGTLNGTKVNGMKIQEPTPLVDGFEIQIGEACLRFSVFSLATDAEPLSPPSLLAGRPAPDSANTLLRKDELVALCAFMSASESDSTSQGLISRALETVRDYLQAGLAGYLSLDASDPVPKLVVPRQSSLDAQLSKQLTQMVQEKRRSVWLRGESTGLSHTDSLLSFADALCVPLSAAGATLGALHVYRTAKLFTEDDLRFCEVLGDFLAKRLFLLRMRRSLEAENSRLREHAGAASDDRLVGDSEALNEVRQRILRLAGTNSTVLITGESGVGKELVAMALHRQSPRKDGPLVVVNCGAIAPALAEAELFGTSKGAFTGADRDRPGYFEQADEGTLFLDEIGELSPECQAKVLRVIEGKGFRKVGGTVELHVDVRVVAATHRNLERDVSKNKFRKDLYYRLGVPIKVPPLRDRSVDIPVLVAHFLKKLSAARNRVLRVTDEALRSLQEYHWPGNVRQLWKVLEHAIDMSEDGLLDVADLRLHADEPSSGITPPLHLEQLEAWAIRRALVQCDKNLSQAARLLGVHRDTLASKMKKYAIEKNEVEE